MLFTGRVRWRDTICTRLFYSQYRPTFLARSAAGSHAGEEERGHTGRNNNGKRDQKFPHGRAQRNDDPA